MRFTIYWDVAGFALRAALLLTAAQPAIALTGFQDDLPSCTTKSECDYRAQVRDQRARQAEGAATAKRNEDAVIARQNMRQEMRAASESDKLARAREVLRRRREAAAGNN